MQANVQVCPASLFIIIIEKCASYIQLSPDLSIGNQLVGWIYGGNCDQITEWTKSSRCYTAIKDRKYN